MVSLPNLLIFSYSKDGINKFIISKKQRVKDRILFKSSFRLTFLSVSVFSLAQKLILCRARYRIIMQKTAAAEKSLNIFISCYCCDIQ